MKFNRVSLPFLGGAAAVFAGIVFTGCERPPVQPKVVITGQADSKDPIQTFLNAAQYPESPRDSDDYTRFGDGVQHLTASLPQGDFAPRRLMPEERAFLEKEVGLDADEFAELETSLFRAPDAHYLDECFLLHDTTSKVLDIRVVGPRERVRAYFDWVMRNVMLHEQGDACTPPAFTLRRGCGSALERAMVFLALLRQIQIEGCLIVVPDAKPLTFLVGVHDGKTANLLLFDTRLGLPVRGKDGQKVATLKEALAEPDLLKPSLIGPEQAKKLEAWLVCPLYAMAPRQRALQSQLRKSETIVLYLNPLDFKTEIAGAAGIPVKTWGTSIELKNDDGVRPTISPTRWLRAFLPKQEGGSDDSAIPRVAAHAQNLVPLQAVMASYARVNLTPALLPKTAYLILQHVSRDLLSKYGVHMRELYLRGKFDPMILRQERMRAFAKDESLSALALDGDFAQECLKWVRDLREAQANLPDDPKAFEQATKALQAQWFQDEFVGWLVTVDKEKQVVDRKDLANRKNEKTILARIFAVGLRGYFDVELARSQASTNHEKAEQADAGLRAYDQPRKADRKRAQDAWEIAKSSWSNFYLDRINLDHTIQAQLSLFDAPAPPSLFENLDRNVSLTENVHTTVHKYFHAKLRLAECLEHTDGAKAARECLQEARKEIEALEKKGLLAARINDVRNAIPQSFPVRSLFVQRLDLLARDWSAQGNFFWLKKQIDERSARLGV